MKQNSQSSVGMLYVPASLRDSFPLSGNRGGPEIEIIASE